MTGPGQGQGQCGPETGRARYLVRVVKRADPADRVVFRELFPDQEALDEHGWCDAWGALDDDTASEPGEVAWFSVELDHEQVAAFAADPDVTALELAPPPLHRSLAPHPRADAFAVALTPPPVLPLVPPNPGATP